MLNYDKLLSEYPTIKEEIPDSQLILFCYELVEKDLYPDNLSNLIGMLKYLFKNGITGYEDEFRLLLKIYDKLHDDK